MINQEIIREIVEEMAGERSRVERRWILEKWTGILGVEKAQIYREIRKMKPQTHLRQGFGGHRKDKGKLRVGISEEQMKAVALLIYVTWSEKNRIPMPAWVAIRQAEAMGIIPADMLIAGTLNRWMAAQGVAKQMALLPTPHVEMRTDGPNHVHEYDVSVCAQWYLKTDGEVGHQRRDLDVYKNKPDGKGPSIKRHVIVDHYSGAFFVEYARSEDAATSLDFLFDAWCKKRDEKFIFRGTPRILYTDNGNVVRSAVGKQVLERLGIESIQHKVGNPRAKGSVEGFMWQWEQCFESLLKANPARSLEDLNHRAFGMAMWMNANREHSRHGKTRFECWAGIAEAELRELPEEREALRALAMRASEERNIDYRGYVRFDGLLYEVPDRALWGKKVMAGPDVFHQPDIVIECEGRKFRLSALAVDEGGFTERAVDFGTFREPRETRAEKGIKKIAGMVDSYPQNTQIDTEIAGIKSPDGIMIEMDVPVEKIYGRVQGKAELARRLGYPLSGWQMDIVERMWGARAEVTEEAIADMAGRLSGMEMAVAR